MDQIGASLDELGEMPDPAEQKKSDAAAHKAARKAVRDMFRDESEIDGEYEVVPPSEKGEDNPCGLKLKYKKKNGKVTGSFKVYAVAENKKGKLKLKKFSGKVSGYFEAEELTVTVKKVGTFGATLE